MEIGGVDLVLEGPTSDEDWIVIFHTARALWPDCVLNRIDCGEAMIFRDQEAADADDFVEGAMVHILVSEDSITVVHDEAPTDSFDLGTRLHADLVRHRCGVQGE